MHSNPYSSIPPETHGRVAAADARWFRRHPERSYRFRRAMNGELPRTGCHWIVVKQIEPGVRIRKPLFALAEGGKVPNEDAELARLFEAAMQGRTVVAVGGRVFEPAKETA